MNTIHTRSWLLLGLFALSSATAAPASKPLTTAQATFTISIPEGAKSVAFTDPFPNSVSAYVVQKGSKTMTVTLKLTPKKYFYTYDAPSAGGELKEGAGANFTMETPYQLTVKPLGARNFSPALGQWSTLWQGTLLPWFRGDTAHPFQMRVVFSDKSEAQAKTLRPPKP